MKIIPILVAAMVAGLGTGLSLTYLNIKRTEKLEIKIAELNGVKQANDSLTQVIDYIKNNGSSLEKFEVLFYKKNRAVSSTLQQLQKAGKNQETDLILMHNCYSAYMEACAEVAWPDGSW